MNPGLKHQHTFHRSLAPFSPSNLAPLRRLPGLLLLSGALAGLTLPARAQTLYWDANGAATGAGGPTPTGTWGTDLFWSADPNGEAATGAWTSGATAVFAAGTDATGAYTVTVSGTQTAGAMTIEEGAVTIAVGAVSLGAGNITLAPGTLLSTDSSLRITATAGSTINANGATLRTTNPGGAGTFYDADFKIIIGPLGCTFSHVTTNILNIIQTAMVIEGTGGFTKIGDGVLAIAGTCTYAGPTVINQGEIRIRGTANRLPVTTAVTVNRPGILNLNGLAQQIGSLAGNGDVGIAGTASQTLTVGNATDTVFSGSLKNIANAGAGGGATGVGRVLKVGGGTLTLTGTNTYTGTLTLSNGAITLAPNAVLCDPVCDLVVQGGVLNLSNTAQTVLTLSGNGGTIHLGTGHTLTVNPTSGLRAFAGTLAGDGSLTKSNAGTLVLAGPNTYSGPTLVAGGTLSASNTAGSATGTGTVTVNPGATLTGPGAITGPVVLNGAIAPGASPGTLTTGSETWNGGASYVWEINDADAGAGTDPGWDLLNILGTLTLSATPASKFTLKLTSLTPANIAGAVADFDPDFEHVWKIATTTGGVSGFDAAAFAVDTSAFSNPIAGVFRVELVNSGNDLQLHYYPFPVITDQPDSLVVCPGAPASFSVSFSSTLPTTNQWYRNGTPVLGALGTTLSIASVGPAHVGDYTVVIGNAGAAVTSAVATLSLNLPPVALPDGVGTAKNTALAIATATLLANDSDPEGGALTFGTVSSPTTQGGSALLAGPTITYTPPTGFTGGDYFTYTISDVCGNLATGKVCVLVNTANAAYPEPTGGWTYVYTGDAATAGVDNSGYTSLDGTWNHDNGSDAWALDGLGGPFVALSNPPGGVVSLSGYLRVQDTGDPRDYGYGESNAGGNAGSVGSDRKLYFGRNITSLGASPTILNDGVTLTFRARVPTSGMDDLYPDGGSGIVAYPAAGDGYFAHDGGKGNIGIRQANGGIISFSLTTPYDPISVGSGLFLNGRNSTTVSGDVDPGDPGVVATNFLALDSTQWHEFWVTIVGDTSGGGTHRVEVYADGSLVPQVFHVTAGNGAEGQFGAISYLALGTGSTGQSGAVDVDFVGFKAGVIKPTAFNEPVGFVQQPASATVNEGLVTFNVGVTGTPPIAIQWFTNSVAVPGANGSSYSFTATFPAHDGLVISVGASNLCSSVTSTNAVLTVLDSTPPVVNCPGNIIATAPTFAGTVVTYSTNATDNCPSNLVFTCSPPSGSTFPAGATPVNCSAIDCAGNSNGCTFVVRVLVCETHNFAVGTNVPDRNFNGLADTRVLSSSVGAISNVVVTLNISNGWNGDLYAYLEHDNQIAVLLNRVGVRASNPIGYGDDGFDIRLDDAASNGDVHVYRFTLFGNDTNRLTGPLTGTWAPDGRQTNPTNVLDTDPRTAFLSAFRGLNPNGAWTLYIADVEGGDESTLVSWGLEICGERIYPPVIVTQPQSQTIECGDPLVLTVVATGTPPVDYQWYKNGTAPANAIPGATSPTLTINPAALANSGSYYVSVSNAAARVFSIPAAVVTVQDTTPPVLVCNSNRTVECAGPAGTPVTFVVNSTDVCDGTLPVTCNWNSGALFPLGTTTVTCRTGDSSGNSNQCSFSVTVQDTTPPALACPPDLYLSPDPGQCTASGVSLGTPVVSDVCGSVSVVNNAPAIYPLGGTPVVWTATDGVGLVTTCTQWVSVLNPPGGSYAGAVLSQGPIAYYRLNESGAVAASVATNLGNLGATGNGAYLGANSVPGALDGSPATAAGLNGLSSKVDVPYDAALNASGAFTIECWARPASPVAPSGLRTPVSSLSAALGRYGYVLWQSGTNWLFRVGGGADYVLNLRGGLVQVGAWQHIVGVVDSAGLATLYVNGVNVGSASLSGPYAPNTLAPLRVGATGDGTGTLFFDGAVDEVAFYNRALTAARVQAHYQNGTNASRPTPYASAVLIDVPVGYWPLDELGQTVALNSGSLGAVANGTYQNGSTPGVPGPRPPQFIGFEPNNTAASFNGTSGYISTLVSLLNNRSAFTLSGWMRRAGAQTLRAGLFGQNDVVEVGYTNNATLQARAGVTSPAFVNVTTPFPDNEWDHVAVVGNGATVVLYTNAQVAGSASYATANYGSNAFKFNIGGGGIFDASGNFFKGLLDEVAVFDKALPAEAIGQQYYTAASGAAPVILAQPQGTNAQAGQTITLYVGVSGSLPLTVQWSKDGSPVSGATNTSLVLPGIGVADAGIYQVVIENCYGAVTSVLAVVTVNRPPVAENDGFGTTKDVALNLPTSSLLVNDSDPDLDPLTVISVTSPSVYGGTAVLVGTTVTYTPPAGYTGGDRFCYTISDGKGGTASACVCLNVNAASLVYPEPTGGWTYVYTGAAAAGQPRRTNAFALDGTWRHENGSDEWNGDIRGAGNDVPGGVESSGGILTIEDAVTTTSGNNNNRKIYFTHDVRQDGVTGSDWLNRGLTMSFRARLTPPDGRNEIPLPDGYGIFSDGKGMFGVRQSSPSSIISFSLVREIEDLNPTTPITNPAPGLVMNKLNGDSPTGNVDSNETGGTTNLLALDPTQWHEFWITIQTNDLTAGNGTHTVRIWVDGALTPAVFNVSAGTGNDPDSTVSPTWTDYIALGLNNSPTLGAFDTDFFAYKAGVIVPSGYNEPIGFTQQPSSVTVPDGTTVTFNAGVTGTPPFAVQWFANGLPIAGATSLSYTRVAVFADSGTAISVEVSNLCSRVLSTNAILTVTPLPPVIVLQPAGQSVTVGGTATFTVSATGTVPLGYQWWFLGSPLPGATGTSLTIPNVGVANEGAYTVVVSNVAGVVTSTPAILNIYRDFGDAPWPYPTVLAGNGAWHFIVPGVQLGTNIDAELDGQPNPLSDGDDLNGVPNDEDGLLNGINLLPGQPAVAQFWASTNGVLNGWVDFDANGTWAEPGEQVFINAPLTAGLNVLGFVVPINARVGPVYARFRFSTASSLPFFGPAPDGEVEDYLLVINPVADVSVVKLSAPPLVGTGQDVTYSITLSNAGPNPATSATLYDSLPPGLVFVAAAASQGYCSSVGNDVACDVGTLLPGATATVTITATVNACTSVTNLVNASASEVDLNLANNTASAVNAVFDATAPVGPGCTGQAIAFAAGGTNDNFTGPELSSPSLNLLMFLGDGDDRPFDDPCWTDAWLAHTFTNLPANVIEARLRVRLKACADQPENDRINLAFVGPGGVPQPEFWTRRIGTYLGDPGLLPTAWSSGMITELVLDLGRLTNADNSVLDLIPTLNTTGFLDVYIHDDTVVDYIVLEVLACGCRPDLVVPQNAGCGAIVAFDPPAFTDNCDTSLSITCSPPSGSYFPTGDTLVLCTATDDAGNQAQCSFTVKVTELTQPTLSWQRYQVTNILITWPVTCAPWQLEQTDSLNPTIVWVPAVGQYSVVGNENRFVAPASQPMRFFRLRKL